MAFECYPVILKQEENKRRAEVFYKMQEQSLDKVIFYSLDQASIQDWLDVCSLPNGWTIPIYSNKGELCAASWLNGFMGRTAFIHFVVFKEFNEHAVDLGNACLKEIFSTQHFDSLLGLTPDVYRHALNYIKNLGFELSPIKADGACYMAKHKKYRAGVFSKITKKDLKGL